MSVSGGKAAMEWRGYWTLPLAAALGYSISVIHVYSMGPYLEPLQQEFGWTRAQASLGITITNVINAIFCIPVGMLVDRLGPRLIGLIGTLLIAAAYALLGTATGSIGNWIALWCIVAFGVPWVQSMIWTSAVASRFEISRGLAFAVTLSGASMGAAIFPLLATWLISSHGWRVAFTATGGIWVLLVFPVLCLCFRGARDQGRETRVARPDTANALTGLSLSEGLRLPAFYQLLTAGCLFAFTIIGIVVHFVPILTDRGTAPLAAAGVASLIGLFAIAGRLGTGLLLDRFPGHLVGASVFLLANLACVLLLLDSTYAAGHAVAAAIVGLTLGAEVDVIAYLATRHFGLRNFGGLFGGLVAALALGAAFGPLAAAAIFDRHDSYTPFLMLGMALMTTSSLALATLQRPRFYLPADIMA